MRVHHVIAATAGLVLALGTANVAQAANCNGKLFIDSVYQNGLGSNKYEYMLQLRNGTAKPQSWTIQFGGFPPTVSIFSPQLSGGPQAANTTQTIRWGDGTWGNLNTSTVTVVYDRLGSGGKPWVSLMNCTPG